LRSATPETRYTKSGDLNIAYQVVGEGPLDLIYVPGWISNLELNWEEPAHAHVLDRLASFSRLILFDKRGTGMSDPVPLDGLPTLEERMDDVRAVLDAVECQQAALFGFSEGGLMSILFAATYPERITALALYGTFAKRIKSPDYPWAPSPEDRARELENLEQHWAERMDLDQLAPSEDDAFKDRLATYFRRSASPGAAVTLMRMNT
jgi:pimeloyl-ACP methyl ester carboxylesterase